MSIESMKSAINLATVRLSPVVGGKIAGDAIDAESLWSSHPTMVFVIRRPGWVLCREDALEISSRFKSGEYSGANLVGIIKEVAPVSGAETDEILGVGQFQTKYFNNYPVYLDHDKVFYSYLGNKSLLSQPLHTWNPFRLYTDYKTMSGRLSDKGVEGNLKGEGLLKGGLLIIHPSEGIVYQHEESTGTEMPYNDFKAALDKLKESSSSETCDSKEVGSSEGK